MFKSLLQKSGFLFLLLFMAVSSSYASGKMEVLLGDTVTLQPEELGANSNYEWVLTDSRGEILLTQAQENFNYTFLEGGEYKVTVKATDRLGQQKITTVMILVGDLYKVDRLSENGGGEDFANTPLKVVYSTLPATTSQNTIPLIGEGTVLFDLNVSRSDIIEYRIDRNIFVDSDGNGIANDDIDNATDDSYLRGGVWQTVYIPGEATKIVPEITVVTRTGEVAKAQTEVTFQNPPSKTADLLAVLDVVPQPKPNTAKVELYDDVQIVGFYSRASQGNILEYRIDENIFVDSDRDGNPANDIDNLNDPSFKTGDVWTTTYQRTQSQIIAQLTVVGEGGKGNRIQREVIFTDRPTVDLGPAGQPTEIFISADKTVVLKGSPVLLTVQGLTQRPGKYTFDWDLDGDGKSDKQVEGDNTLNHLYETAGLYKVTVLVKDEDGNQAQLALDVLVKEAEKTTADFEYKIDGAQVTFTNLSQAAFGLADNNLRYTWSFGDTNEESFKAQQAQIGVQNPVYTYPYQGTYLVTLTVVDADQVVDEKTVEIVIDEAPSGPGAGEDNSSDSAGRSGIVSLLLKILKWVGIVLLIIVGLGSGLFAGAMLVIKLQHSELTFGELVDEVKLKILGLLGVHDLVETEPAENVDDIAKVLEGDLDSEETVLQGEVIPPKPQSPSSPLSRQSSVQESATSNTPLEKVAGDIDFEAAPGTEGPMPAWLKKAQSQSTPPNAESTSSKSTTEEKNDEEEGDKGSSAQKDGGGPKEPNSPNGAGKAPVPDWLKAGQMGEKFTPPTPKDTPPSAAAERGAKVEPGPSKAPENPKSQAPSKGEDKKAPLPDWLKPPASSSGVENGPKSVNSPSAQTPLQGEKKSEPNKPEPVSNIATQTKRGDSSLSTNQTAEVKTPQSSPAMPPWLQKASQAAAGENKNSQASPVSNPASSPSSVSASTNKTVAQADLTKAPSGTESQLKKQEPSSAPKTDEKKPEVQSPPPRMPAWLQVSSEAQEAKGDSPQKPEEKTILPQQSAVKSPYTPSVESKSEGMQGPQRTPVTPMPTPSTSSVGDSGQKAPVFTGQPNGSNAPQGQKVASVVRDDPFKSSPSPVSPKANEVSKKDEVKNPIVPQGSIGKNPVSIPSKVHAPQSGVGALDQKENPRPKEDLMKDFVSKKPDSSSKPEAVDPKSQNPVRVKGDNLEPKNKKDLPAWLQPSPEKAKKNDSIKINPLKEKLPEPLPPLDRKKPEEPKVAANAGMVAKAQKKVVPTPKQGANGSEKVTPLTEKDDSGKKNSASHANGAKKDESVLKPAQPEKRPEAKPVGGHVELSVEDLQKGGEFKL